MNWAGYAKSGNRGDFTSVEATWVVPTATCGANETSYAAFWVGLDGYGSHSVEQTGSDSDCAAGTPTYFAWYEMYPKAPVVISSLTIGAADTVSASVTYSGGAFTLALDDLSDGVPGFQITLVSRGAARASAEMIVEAPSRNPGIFGVLPLADFGTVDFTGATVNGGGFGSLSPDEFVMKGLGGTTRAQVSAALGTSDSFSVEFVNH